MAGRPLLLICLIVAFVGSEGAETAAVKPTTHYSIPFNRSSFPPSFIFGAGSAAYQVNLIKS